MLQQISGAELDIMRIVWASEGPALFSFIMDELAKKGKPWQKNTVITLLSRLMEKGFLKAKKIGRKNEYTAVVSAEDYQKEQTKAFVNTIFEGNVKGLVTNLIQGDLLSADEYADLKKLLEGERDD